VETCIGGSHWQESYNFRGYVGSLVRIAPGQSICLPPRTFHQFWAEEGTGESMSGEVSTVCNDLTDNYFLEPRERFPEIEEDEPPRFVLCNQYPPVR
jgi:D-lyxose ketol-isomerase